ncbi:unnamed protein product [Urochloa humidicola]
MLVCEPLTHQVGTDSQSNGLLPPVLSPLPDLSAGGHRLRGGFSAAGAALLSATARRPAAPRSRVWRAPAMDESGSDDVLLLVLERVDSHVSLIRAAAVCRRWRRAIADAAFLRRYRSIHAPAVAGEFHNSPWIWNKGPVFLPTSPPLVDTRHFSLDFLPGGTASWILQDSRGSLLLLCHPGRSRFSYEFAQIVCEPLTQRYKRIPPADLDDNYYCRRSYLIDGEAGSCIGMSNFRVVSMFTKSDDANMHVAMYTVGLSWSEKNFDRITPNSNCSSVGHGGGCSQLR